MALEHGSVVEHNIHPVHIYRRQVIVVLACGHAYLLLVLDTFFGIHEVPVAVRDGRPSELHPVTDVRTVHVASALGCDHDHAVGGTRTVDRGR